MRFPFKDEEVVGWNDPSYPYALEEFVEYVQREHHIQYDPYRSVSDWKSVSLIWKKSIFDTKLVLAIFGV